MRSQSALAATDSTGTRGEEEVSVVVADSVAERAMRDLLQSVVQLEEAYFREHGTFVVPDSSLERLKGGTKAWFTFETRDSTNFSVFASYPMSTRRCLVAVGVPGVPSGEIRCQ